MIENLKASEFVPLEMNKYVVLTPFIVSGIREMYMSEKSPQGYHIHVKGSWGG